MMIDESTEETIIYVLRKKEESQERNQTKPQVPELQV